MTIAEKTKSDTVVQPWGIEADHPRNCDLLVQSIPGLRLRGGVGAGKTVKDPKTGTDMIPTGQAAFLGKFPPIPGMQLKVNPAQLNYVVVDPLYEDEALCDRIQSTLRREGQATTTGRLRGLPPQKGTLDRDRMKTLLREMLNLVDANEAKVCFGAAPTREAVDTMPGEYLLNPGSRVFNTQPRYEKDYEAWVERLSHLGG